MYNREYPTECTRIIISVEQIICKLVKVKTIWHIHKVSKQFTCYLLSTTCQEVLQLSKTICHIRYIDRKKTLLSDLGTCVYKLDKNGWFPNNWPKSRTMQLTLGLVVFVAVAGSVLGDDDCAPPPPGQQKRTSISACCQMTGVFPSSMQTAFQTCRQKYPFSRPSGPPPSGVPPTPSTEVSHSF